MPSPSQILRLSARHNGCSSFIPFGQGSVIANTPTRITPQGGGRGICFGLSVAWLEAHLKNTSVNFTADAQNYLGSNVFSRAHLFWENQNSPMWLRLTGLKFIDNEEFDDMQEFTDFVNGSLRTRYCLVKVRKHAMAACGSLLGGITFFDPNAGIVHTSTSRNMARCLSEYFSDLQIKTMYQRVPQNRVILNVDRFK